MASCPAGFGALVWPELHPANSAPTTSHTAINTPRPTCPDTMLFRPPVFRLFRPPVAGPDLLTRTSTIHFHDLLQEVEPAAPDWQTSLACTRRLDTCTDARRRCPVACSLVQTIQRERASVSPSRQAWPTLAPLAQLAEQLTLNQRVRGSSPWRRTTFPGRRSAKIVQPRSRDTFRTLLVTRPLTTSTFRGRRRSAGRSVCARGNGLGSC
jgi:hypothetical protein